MEMINPEELNRILVQLDDKSRNILIKYLNDMSEVLLSSNDESNEFLKISLNKNGGINVVAEKKSIKLHLKEVCAAFVLLLSSDLTKDQIIEEVKELLNSTAQKNNENTPC